MLKYETLKTKPRELLATTSLNQDEFEKLLKAFEAAYEEACPAGQTIGGESRQRRQGGGRKSRLESMADKLLFILVYEKTYPLQMVLGLQFGVSQGRANEWIHRLTPVLRSALARL